MVFGPILDMLAARDRGVSAVQVLSEGNLRVSRLPLATKVAFWLTNLPYYVLAFELSVGAAPRVGGPRTAHALAAVVVASISTAFHGSVLFGPVQSAWPRRLLAADITAANGYGAALAVLRGPSFAIRRFGIPLVFLAGAARTKRSGAVTSYAWLHGAWHILSCYAIWRCLYDEVEAGQ